MKNNAIRKREHFRDTARSLCFLFPSLLGVGVFFITQSPADIPMPVLGQLGNRIQHALRAYTPLDQKAVKVAAQTFRTNPAFDTEEAITTLKTGEALISFLDEHGAPGVVERATILPPQSHMGAISAEERTRILETSPLAGVYETRTDQPLQQAPDQASPGAGMPVQPLQFIPVNGVLRQVSFDRPTEYVSYNGYLWPVI